MTEDIPKGLSKNYIFVIVIMGPFDNVKKCIAGKELTQDLIKSRGKEFESIMVDLIWKVIVNFKEKPPTEIGLQIISDEGVCFDLTINKDRNTFFKSLGMYHFITYKNILPLITPFIKNPDHVVSPLLKLYFRILLLWIKRYDRRHATNRIC